MYASPGKEFDQSDIFEKVYFHSIDEERLAILITPICDIHQDKADYYTFCGIFPLSELVTQFIEKSWPELKSLFGKTDNYNNLSSGDKDKVTKKLSMLRDNFHFPRYHWLDPFPGKNLSYIIDFQVLSSISCEEAKNYKRFYSIISPYREQIPARYSAYMSRVGVPKKDAKDIIESASKDAFSTFKQNKWTFSN